MLDATLRPLVDPPLVCIARALQRWAPMVTPTSITLFNLVFVGLAFVSLVLGWYYVGLGFIIINRILDGLDGTLAQITGPTTFGAYCDTVCDYIFYSAVVLGFGLSPVGSLDAAAILLVAIIICEASFLTFAVMQAKHEKTWQAKLSKKGFFYSHGLIEGTETIVFFILFCLYPTSFKTMAIILAIGCILTSLLRSYSLFDLTRDKQHKITTS